MESYCTVVGEMCRALHYVFDINLRRLVWDACDASIL